MRSTLVSWGYSRLDASTLISKAVSVFCPKYSKVVTEIANDSGNAGGGPTNADGAELVKEVRDRGILQNHHDVIIVQTLAAICDSARNLAPYGVTDDVLADSVLAEYGLSKKDAKWLTKTSLAKCHWA